MPVDSSGLPDSPPPTASFLTCRSFKEEKISKRRYVPGFEKMAIEGYCDSSEMDPIALLSRRGGDGDVE